MAIIEGYLVCKQQISAHRNTIPAYVSVQMKINFSKVKFCAQACTKLTTKQRLVNAGRKD